MEMEIYKCFSIIEEVKEAVLDYSGGTVKVLETRSINFIK